MKRATCQEFPAGWNAKKVLAVIAHYDRQTDEEAAAEIEAASEAADETWMSVPAEFVGVVKRLIEEFAKNGAPGPSRNLKKKSQRSRKSDRPPTE
jgi:hypothetical protein